MPRYEGRMESPWVRAFRFAILGGAVGAAGGMGLTLSLWLFAGIAQPMIGVGMGVGGFAGGFLIGIAAREGIGSLVERATAGTRGRSKKEYSEAQALVARGAYREAVAHYRDDADENPDDPEPILRGARVLRDDLRRYDEAAAWLRRASRMPGLSEEAEITIVRELIELYDGPLGRPQEALPDLARLAEKYGDTRVGHWARTRHARIRAVVWQDVKADGDTD